MTIENTVLSNFDPRSSIVDSVFDCRLPGVSLVFRKANWPALDNSFQLSHDRRVVNATTSLRIRADSSELSPLVYILNGS